MSISSDSLSITRFHVSNALRSGGVRDTTPFLKQAGLSFQATMPLSVAAKLCAEFDQFVEMGSAVEIADHIGPFADAGEGDRRRALAHREAFHRLDGDIEIALVKPRAQRLQ